MYARIAENDLSEDFSNLFYFKTWGTLLRLIFVDPGGKICNPSKKILKKSHENED